MDLLDIVIVAAAAVGVIAFITLAVVIVRQGRALKRIDERVGPPVPMAAAPSLERVRAIAAQPEIRVDVPVDPVVPQGVPDAAAPAAAAAAAAVDGPSSAPPPPRADSGARPPAQRPSSAGSGGGKKKASKKSGGGNGALVALVGIIALVVIVGGVWFMFLRGGSDTPASAGGGAGVTATTGTTSTAADTASEVPADVPPLANKAAYTVAVLNASGVPGAAANRVAPRVQSAGYTLGVVDNASQQDLTSSVVQYVSGRKEVAWNVARDLGITTAGPVDSLSQGRIGTADVVIVVGKDLSK